MSVAVTLDSLKDQKVLMAMAMDKFLDEEPFADQHVSTRSQS